MRSAVLAAAFLLSACGSSEDPAKEQPGPAPSAIQQGLTSFAGKGRDRLCLDESARRVAFITYGEGDANCTVQGAVQGANGTATIVPDGDSTCRIDLTTSGDMVRLGAVTAACAYYCGPTSSFAGAEFRRTNRLEPVTDVAGDPLC